MLRAFYAQMSPRSMGAWEEVAARVAAHGGGALAVDYGEEGPIAHSLQAIRQHAFVDVLDRVGSADLSAHVDFGALRLAADGAAQRAAQQAGPGAKPAVRSYGPVSSARCWRPSASRRASTRCCRPPRTSRRRRSSAARSAWWATMRSRRPMPVQTPRSRRAWACGTTRWRSRTSTCRRPLASRPASCHAARGMQCTACRLARLAR